MIDGQLKVIDFLEKHFFMLYFCSMKNKITSYTLQVIFGTFSIRCLLNILHFTGNKKMQHAIIQHFNRKSGSCYFRFFPVIFSVNIPVIS
jgi:hypothetical protein